MNMSVCEVYSQPQTIEEALDALQQSPGPAEVIAGGTDLLLDLRQGRHSPVHTLVDVSGIEEMKVVRCEEAFIFLGAAMTMHDIVHNSLLNENAQCLVEACSLIGGPQVRNVATIGGNVAHALPAADGTISLLALEAHAQIASTEGVRFEPLSDLFLGPGESALDRRREILTGFRFQVLGDLEASAFQRVMRPQGMAIAILNMAAWVRLDSQQRIEDVRLSIGPAGPTPVRAHKTEGILKDEPFQDRTLRRATQALLDEIALRTSPHRATVEYRKHLSEILLRRTLQCAIERAANRGSKVDASQVRDGSDDGVVR